MRPRTLRQTTLSHPADARTQNRSVVLQHLFQSGPESRAELARSTGLTRVTISALIEDLLAEGLVSELGRENRPGKVGKRATLVGLSEDNWQIAAATLTNDGIMSGAIMSLTGTLLHRVDEPRVLPGGPQAVPVVTDFCRKLVALADTHVLGLGISSPGIISPDGVIEQAPNLGWFDLPLASLLQEELDVPVRVANDANAAALAEFTFHRPRTDTLLRITIGVGVGAGVVDAGALIHGTDNAAGEIGHVTVIDEDSRGPLGPPRPCACGRSGCLETVLSQSALRCVAAGEWGDDVVGIMNAIGVQLGTVLAPVTATLNVADIIIAGPEGIDLSPLLQATEQTIRKRTLPRSHRNLRVHLSSIGVDGALRGAAVLVLSGQLGIS